MTAPVAVAVIGAGVMGAHHARVVAQSDRASLHAVIDADGRRADEVAAAWQAPSASSLDAIEGCVAAVIATPTESHESIAMQLLDRGIALLIEKPLAHDLAAVERIVARADAVGVPLLCGFVERFNPAFETARSLLEEPPVHVVGVRHSPPNDRIVTGVVHDMLIHDLDLAVLLCGQDTATVHAVGWPTGPGDRAEVVDASVRFTSGALASLSADRAGQRKIRTLSISTPSMLAEVDLLRQDVTVYRHVRHEGGALGYRAETVMDIPFIRQAGEPLARQLDRFLDVVTGEADADAERRALLPSHRLAAAVVAAASS